MVPIFQWICFWLISESNSVYGSTHAVIGNYTQLNPKNCGISYMSIGFSDICFEWHKNPLSLREGRDPLPFEAPWAVTIFSYDGNDTHVCGGSLIGDQWIITALHCIYSADLYDYEIYFATGPINQTETPRFDISEIHTPTDNGTDLAIMKLASAVNSSTIGSPVKSICLPAPHIIHTEPEYAITMGRGGTYPWTESAQLGYRRIITDYTDIVSAPNYSDWRNISNMLFTMPADDQGLNCQGDSGSPLWQYTSGRAVLIAVLAAGPSDVECNDFNGTATGWSSFMRVSQYIDWIKDVTKLN